MSEYWSLIKRKDIVASMPWVDRLDPSEHRCGGIKWNTVASRDLYWWGPGRQNPPRGIQDHSRCQNRGAWWLKSLARPRKDEWSGAETGVYCWIHLLKQIGDYDPERRRVDKFLEKIGESR